MINRLRGKLARIPGATLYMQAAQDIRVGGRGSNSQYQYTLQSDKLADLNEWAPKLLAKLKTMPACSIVSFFAVNSSSLSRNSNPICTSRSSGQQLDESERRSWT